MEIYFQLENKLTIDSWDFIILSEKQQQQKRKLLSFYIYDSYCEKATTAENMK